MNRLIDLFDYVWDVIETSCQKGNRPKGNYENPTVASPDVANLERFPVSAYFEKSVTAVSISGFETLATMLRDSKDLLTWSQNESYSASKLGQHFMDNYVTGQLTGPGAPIAQEAPPSGFILLGENTLYRAHFHLPDEVYLVLTPDIEWCLDNKAWFPVSPGDVIYHAPNQSHAIRTGDTPMIAFAAWLQKGLRKAIDF
jgi:hypothetical protein